jgi:hypothetical protein
VEEALEGTGGVPADDQPEDWSPATEGRLQIRWSRRSAV